MKSVKIKDIYELVPINGRKSFGHKAKVLVGDTVKFLKSYETIIGSIDLADGTMHRYSGYYSSTTNNHVISFVGGKDKAKRFWDLKVERCPKITTC